MNEPLLAILSALVATLIWVVKTQQTRGDMMMARRDAETGKLIKTLEVAVSSFADFKQQADEIHGRIVDDLRDSAEIQRSILNELRVMNESAGTRKT